MALVAALILLLLANPAAFAVQYMVGDTNGWTSGEDYTTWVQGKTFTEGDTLLFTYDGTHKVNVVTQSDYDNCNTGNSLKSYSDGKTVITLESAGPMYFICPTPGHCAGGMKLAVDVVAASGGSPSPTTPSPPSPSGGSTTPGRSPSTGSSAPPNGAATISSINSLMLGFSVVLGAVLASMMS